MTRDHVSGHGTTLSLPGRPDHSRAAKVKRRKGKGKGQGKGRSKRTGRAFFGDERVQDPEWWQEEDQVWWSNGKKGKKGLSKGNDGFQKGGFRPYQPGKRCRQGLSPKQRQRKGSKRDKAKKEPFLNPDCQPQNHPMKKYMDAPGNQRIGLPVIGVTILGLQMLSGSAQRLILHGWWQLH